MTDFTKALSDGIKPRDCLPKRLNNAELSTRGKEEIFYGTYQQVIDALEKVENIEEIYDVKGEFDIVSIVSASSVEEFRNVLHKKIMKIKGVKSTLVSVVLKSHKSLSNIHMR